jgi:signal peptidase I
MADMSQHDIEPLHEREPAPSAQPVSDDEVSFDQDDTSAAPPEEERRSSKRGFIDLLITIAVAVVLVWGIQHFIARPYRVPSGSMLETIQIDDYVISERVTYYTQDPQPGQIVTFIDPANEDQTLIKRVIATEGDVVDMHEGAVYVNGEKLDEPYTNGKPSYPLPNTLNNMSITYPYTVPEGCMWVMGDNRTNSADSRYFGAVPMSSVTGHACFIYWPISDAGGL